MTKPLESGVSNMCNLSEGVWERAWNSGWNSAMTEGLAQGKTKGEENKGIRVAVNMLKKGLSLSMIAEISELPEEQIRKIAEENRLEVQE
ncbi:MAG: hypothetical protein IJ449_11605 [Clostridia bacterium]|nr:hypothetical protein [Clostridia bacterium]